MTDSYDDKAASNLKSGDKVFSGGKAVAGEATSSASSDTSDKSEMSAEEILITQVAAAAAEAAEISEARAKKGSGGKPSGELGDDASAGEDNIEGEGFEDKGLEAKVSELSDRLSRALAEVENSRRRFERERGDALRYGASRLAMDIFEVADNLGRARGFVSAEAMEADHNLRNLVVGIQMTEKLLGEAFSRNGITTIVPEVGGAFSTDEHQAISEVESEGIAEGCVVEVVLPGYRMAERLLRPAQVVTAKSKGAETDTEKTSENGEKTNEENE